MSSAKKFSPKKNIHSKRSLFKTQIIKNAIGGSKEIPEYLKPMSANDKYIAKIKYKLGLLKLKKT